jgi:two-component system sensor histidine kinase MprB
MTLRARLALSLAALAALSVVIVSVVSYLATDHRLHEDLDAELVGYAQRLAGDRQMAAVLCQTLSGVNVSAGQGPSPAVRGALAGLPEGAVECVDPTGQVTGWTGVVKLPPGRPPSPAVGSSTTLPTNVPPTTNFSPVPPGELPPGSAAPNGKPSRISSPRTETVDGTSYRVLSVSSPGGGEILIGRSLADTDHVLSSLRELAFGVGIAVILLAAAAGWLIARRTARPVLRLTDAAEAVEATGQLEIAVPAGGTDEVGRLTRAFRSMLDALNRSRSQQQRLVQDAGHELRTPLTSLRTNIDTLRLHPDLVGEPRERLLDDLHSELRELSGLVDELVALAVDRYDNEPEQRVAVHELAERAVSRAERRTGRTITLDSQPAFTVGRPGLLLRAISNLLDNAAKFSPDATPIEVTVRPGRLEVRDHGPGIAAEDLPHVFDRFYRAVDVRSRPGSGLGLSIVREAVDDAGGRVRAANDPGGGAVFTVELPAAPDS